MLPGASGLYRGITRLARRRFIASARHTPERSEQSDQQMFPRNEVRQRGCDESAVRLEQE